MDANLPHIPPPPPEARKHPKLGIASLILAITAILFATPYILNWMVVIIVPDAKVNLVVNMMGLAGLMALAGTGLGIAALVKKETSKILGILGLVFSIVILLSACPLGLYVFLIIASNL